MTAPNNLSIRHALEAAGVEFIDGNGGAHKMFVKIMGCYLSETRDVVVSRVLDASERRRSTMTKATTKLNAEDEMMAKRSHLSAPCRRR